MSAVRIAAVPLVLLVGGCVVVNLHFNFPKKELEQKLLEMEKRVREGATPAAAAEEKKAALFAPTLMLMAGPEVQEGPDLKVETPAIIEVNKRREKRVAELKEQFDAGRLGEGNDALLSERDAGGLEGKAKADFRKLVKAENEDRDALIKEIAAANSFEGEEGLKRVRESLAQVFKRIASEGWIIQTRSGEWRPKTREDQEKLDGGGEIE
jgi:hypothetical protein